MKILIKTTKRKQVAFTAKQYNSIVLIANGKCYNKLQSREECWENSGYPNCIASCIKKIFIESGAKFKDVEL